MASDPRVWALLLAATLTIMSNATITPALPGLEASFADTPNAGLLTRLLVTAPSLLVAISAPCIGMASDRFGRRPLLLAGVALYAISGTAGALLPSLEGIFVSRLILGLGVALIMVTQSALVGDYFAAADRGRFMGWQMGATNLGGFVFIALAGWLAGISPRLPFLIYALGFAYLPFLWFALTEPDRSAKVSGGDPAEGHSDWPRIVAIISVMASLTLVLFYIVPTQIPFYLVSIGHPEPAASAQAMALLTITGGISAISFAAVRARLGNGLTPALGYVIIAAGFFALHQIQSMTGVRIGSLLIGLGLGYVMPTFIVSALTVAPERRRGAVSGTVTTALFLGQFLSPLVIQPLVDLYGYPTTFLIAAIVLLPMAALIAWLLGSVGSPRKGAS
ncbi:MFS transporter [Paracoccus sp. M683]|uniref:MFS transporter n=1 Tax=Paracoccus sp. M683 TaxID=2594268 RepID=UPI001180A084|nr:MFS transporter [Paracoccus sp. M683]TRW95298.1 MFS transporter [Paracoccus sp. M683]